MDETFKLMLYFIHISAMVVPSGDWAQKKIEYHQNSTKEMFAHNHILRLQSSY